MVGTVVALSVNYQGVATADVELNDGGVWVSNNDDILVGRLNHPVGQIDASLAATSQNVDLLQRGDTVFVQDKASNTIQRVNTADVANAGGAVQLPAGAEVELGDDTLGVLVPGTGELRVLSLDQLSVLEDASEPPQAELGEGAVQAVADDGTTFGLSVLDGELVTFTPRQRADGSEPETTTLDTERLRGAEVQMTAVGNHLVVLAYAAQTEDGPRLEILAPGERPIDLSGLDVDLASAQLQASSASGRSVAIATRDALVIAPLDGADPLVMPVAEAGEPAAPVQVAGCTHGAWSGATSTYLRSCGDAGAVEQPVPQAIAGNELVFRVNRGIVVLNELQSGSSWMLEDTLILVDNWEDVTPPQQQDETEEESLQEIREEVPLDREAENRNPITQPDSFGVRAGRTIIIPVLDNDTDPDGDLLTVSAFDVVPATFGTVEAILGGRALQIRMTADASGVASFGYTADDGRGGTATGTADLEVVPGGVNNPPEQLRPITVRVVSGASVEVNILNDVRDPDGDAIFISSKQDSTEHGVVASPNGTVTITDLGISVGARQVVVEVSDGSDSAEIVIDLEVLPAGPQPPQAVFDFATAFVGETVVIEPIANDIDPNDKPLRLSHVESVPAVTVVPDLEAGTFTFRTETAGTYYLTYIVADDDGASSTGLVRVTVTAAQDLPPVAVQDTALLPPGGSVLVDVLQNDSDPAGGVLAVQQIDIPAGLGLQVAILDHRILKITSNRALSEPVTIGYTVSNGTTSAAGEVLVLPMEGAAASAPPVAVADFARVRAGDHVTIPVLSNDSHPNGLEFHLDPVLAETPAVGLMFTSQDVLRFQAPEEAQTITAVYRIVDETGQSHSALVTIYVQARSDGANSPPTPRPVETRAFAGERIRIPIETYGIDPDGDSVQLLGPDSAPTLGRIVEVGSSWLDYQPFTASAGTDQFTYAVRDRLGAIATAQITVGVIPPPRSNRSPVAVADAITVRPDRQIQVDVLSNDTDPDGDQLVYDDPAIVDAQGLDVTVQDGNLQFVSPAQAGTLILQYGVDDRHGGSDIGALTITVDENAAPQPPVAVDDIVPSSAILDRTSVDVVVLENDFDPDGSQDTLRLAVPAGTATARVVGRNVQVDLLPTRQVVTYEIRDEDGLASYAFIEVPGTEDTGPVLRTDAPPIEVLAGELLVLPLEDYVVSLSGAPVQITDASTVTATNSDGSSPVVDAHTLAYTSEASYAGPATLTFEVTDAPDINADGILTSVLTLDITVISAGNKPPTLRGGSLDVEAGGEEGTLDLTRLAEDPDGDVADLDYAIVEPVAGFDAEITDGVILRVSAASSTVNGTVEDLRISVTDGDSEPVIGVVTLTATGSTRPVIVANDDDLGEIRQGEAASLDVLGNDSNPFPGEPRTVVDAYIESGITQSVSFGDSTVEITPAADFVGRLVVVYTVGDVTGDVDRQVQARVTASVIGRPATPAPPSVVAVNSREVTLTWTPPNDNGSPITSYRVQAAGVEQVCATTTCTITGLTNGNIYSFTVTATNAVNDSDPSAPSADARPDKKPEAPAAPTLTFGDGQLTVSWIAPVNEGTPITSYDLQISPSPGGSGQISVTGTQYVWTSLTNGQAYTFRVRAINDAPDPGDWSGWSAAEIPSGPPFQPAAPSASRIDSPAGGQISVRWGAPGDNGDSIDAYYLTIYRDGVPQAPIQLSGATLDRTVSVDNAHDYSFTVVAENRAGRSPASPQSASVRSFGAPGQTTGVSAAPTGANGQAHVTYSAPSDNGQAISRYEYSLNGGGAQSLPASADIGGLTNGQSYTVRVRACNTYCGDWSPGSASFSTYGPPGEPAVSSSANGPIVTFNWAPPSGNGATITEVRYRVDGGGWQSAGAGNGSTQVTGDWQQNHTIDVYVVNNYGQQGPTASNSRRAEADPTPPTNPQVWVSRTRDANGQDGCTHPSCAFLDMRYQDLPAGTYTITFYVNGAVWRSYSRNLSGNGTFESSTYRGGPGETIRVTADGPVSREDTITWPNAPAG